MAKIQNVYRDKDTKKWFYKKRLPKDHPTGKAWAIKKGFETAGQAKQALDDYLLKLKQLETTKQENKAVMETIDIENDVMLEAFAHQTLLPYFERNPKRLDNFLTELQQLKAKLEGKSDASNVVLETFTRKTVYPYFKRKLKKGTLESKYNHCEHIFNFFKERTFADIGKKDIASFRSHLLSLKNRQGNPVGSMFINLILCTLGQIYDLACEQEIIEDNVARQVKGLPQKAKTDIDYWTLTEFENFLSVIDDSTYVGGLKKFGFYFLFFSGLRVGEMMARKWSDIDWESESIYVNSTLYFKNVDHWSADPKDGAKNASSIGWVKLTPKIMEMLKGWKATQEKTGKMDYIFMYDGTMYGVHKWRDWKNSLVKEWNKQASVDKQLKNIRVHDLRDSHGMLLSNQGVDLKTIQKRLRHAKATTTMNYYLDKLPEKESSILQNF